MLVVFCFNSATVILPPESLGRPQPSRKRGWIAPCKNVFEAGHNAVLAHLGKELAALVISWMAWSKLIVFHLLDPREPMRFRTLRRR